MKLFSSFTCLLVSLLLPGLLVAADTQLDLSVVDESGKSLPCRVEIWDLAKDEAVKPAGSIFWSDQFVCEGSYQASLNPGDYRLIVERGPEYRRGIQNFSIESGKQESISIQLKRVTHLKSEGWWSGDLHIHRPIEHVPLLMKAEDLHVGPVLTTWNKNSLWAQRSRPERPTLMLDGNRWIDLLGCEDERGGGALLFYGLKEPLDFSNARREFPSPMTFVEQARKQPGCWIDIEKPFWWDVPTWIAFGKMDSLGIANNHMCLKTVLENEAWGKPRDRKKYPTLHGNGLWTQEIYYRLLNCGIRIVPSAGSASGVLPNPVGYNRVYVFLEDGFSADKWWEGLKAGRSFVTNGPLMRVKANGSLSGENFALEKDRPLNTSFEITLTTRDPIRALEIIKNGKVVQTVDQKLFPELDQTGTFTLEGPVFEEAGWFLVRAICNLDQTFRFASTAPWFVFEKKRPGPPCSREDAKFFRDWVEQRIGNLQKTSLSKTDLDQVLKPHHQALRFWNKKIETATRP